MSDEHHVETRAHVIKSSQGGGAGKWLAGAAAAVVLAGGGYFAWKAMNTPQEQQTAQAAYDAGYDSGTVRAAPLPAETARVEEASPAPRRAAAATPSVPEATIGVAPTTVSADEDAIVVPAPRRPIWASTPSARRLSALYPAWALERGREGEARLACTVEERGRLACDRVSETPGGFGAAAVRVAHSFRHATTLADGSSAIGTPVNLRVVFRIAEERGSRWRRA